MIELFLIQVVSWTVRFTVMVQRFQQTATAGEVLCMFGYVVVSKSFLLNCHVFIEVQIEIHRKLLRELKIALDSPVACVPTAFLLFPNFCFCIMYVLIYRNVIYRNVKNIFLMKLHFIFPLSVCACGNWICTALKCDGK